MWCTRDRLCTCPSRGSAQRTGEGSGWCRGPRCLCHQPRLTVLGRQRVLRLLHLMSTPPPRPSLSFRLGGAYRQPRQDLLRGPREQDHDVAAAHGPAGPAGAAEVELHPADGAAEPAVRLGWGWGLSPSSEPGPRCPFSLWVSCPPTVAATQSPRPPWTSLGAACVGIREE